MVHWNGGGLLEPCWAWHGLRIEKVSGPFPYFWADVDGSPDYSQNCSDTGLFVYEYIKDVSLYIAVVTLQ